MAAITTSDIVAVAEFRAALRSFLRRSERIARQSGLTPQRYLLLLMVKGAPDGSEQSTVTELSERLQLAQSTVTELVSRAEETGLIEREQSHTDARVAHLRLTEEGERRLLQAFTGLGDRTLQPAQRVRAPRRRGSRQFLRRRRGHDDLAVDRLVDRVDDRAIVAGPAVDDVPLAVDGEDRVGAARRRTDGLLLSRR